MADFNRFRKTKKYREAVNEFADALNDGISEQFSNFCNEGSAPPQIASSDDNILSFYADVMEALKERL